MVDNADLDIWMVILIAKELKTIKERNIFEPFVLFWF